MAPCRFFAIFRSVSNKNWIKLWNLHFIDKERTLKNLCFFLFLLKFKSWRIIFLCSWWSTFEKSFAFVQYFVSNFFKLLRVNPLIIVYYRDARSLRRSRLNFSLKFYYIFIMKLSNHVLLKKREAIIGCCRFLYLYNWYDCFTL